MPPRQQLVAPGKWPLVGERSASASAEPWRLGVTVAGEAIFELSLAELRELPTVTRTVDFHCVTRWSRLGASVTGVLLETLLESVDVPSDVKFMSWVARSERRHSSSLPLDEALRLGALLTWGIDGEPLASEHGGPLRSVIPGKYFYKSVKWVERIDLLARDRLGHWEAEAGYHNGADPWREQRYVAGKLSRNELRELLATRDWRGRELLSLSLVGHDLAGLNARQAILRNANFARARLTGAVFSRANLSNASLAAAQLAGTDFRDADLEGADFSGADLSGCDFRGASLFGATFSGAGAEESESVSDDDRRGFQGAIFDRETRFDRRQLAALVDRERDFVENALQRAGAAVDEAD